MSVRDVFHNREKKTIFPGKKSKLGLKVQHYFPILNAKFHEKEKSHLKEYLRKNVKKKRFDFFFKFHSCNKTYPEHLGSVKQI